MKIVIDTNILCRDYYLEKPQFRVLFEGRSVIPATIHVPEVVVDEIVNRFREDLENAVSKYFAACKELRLLTRSTLSQSCNVVSEVRKYRAFLVRTFAEREIEVLPYPKTPHKSLVERDPARRKPFKRDGSGYRDALIWESLKQASMWGENYVVFITNNSKDFGPAPHIDGTLAEEICNGDKLRVFPSVWAFNKECVVPKPERLEEIRTLIQKEGLASFDLRQWLETNLLVLLRSYELEDILAGFPPGVGTAWISSIVEIQAIEVFEVRQLDEDEKLVSVGLTFTAECSIESDWEDYVSHPEVREFWGPQSGSFCDISTHLHEHIRATVDIVVSGEPSCVDSQEIVKISADYGELDLGC